MPSCEPQCSLKAQIHPQIHPLQFKFDRPELILWLIILSFLTSSLLLFFSRLFQLHIYICVYIFIWKFAFVSTASSFFVHSFNVVERLDVCTDSILARSHPAYTELIQQFIFAVGSIEWACHQFSRVSRLSSSAPRCIAFLLISHHVRIFEHCHMRQTFLISPKRTTKFTKSMSDWIEAKMRWRHAKLTTKSHRNQTVSLLKMLGDRIYDL